MNVNQLHNSLLAVLFAAGDPLDAQRLALSIQIDLDDLYTLVRDVNDKLCQFTPFVILKLGDCYQLALRQDFESLVSQALDPRKDPPLSQASLETLAVIAYNQPVTRGFIEQVRGIDSAGIVNSLIQKKLVEEAGRLDLPGRPVAYRTTPHFLRCFGLQSLDMLPPVPSEHAPQL